MWEYTGLEDNTRYNNNAMSKKEFDQLMRIITSVTHGAQMHGRVRPLDSNRPPVLVMCFDLIGFSPLVMLRWILNFNCFVHFSDEHCSLSHPSSATTP